MKSIALLTCLAALPLFAQPPRYVARQPNAEQLKYQLLNIFSHYPPSLHDVLALDPGLLQNEAYLAPYPELSAFVQSHPQIIHDPGYYIGERVDRMTQGQQHLAEEFLGGTAVLTGIAMAIGLLIWLVRVTLDFRRWNRLARVQTDFHAKLLEKISGHEELLEYVRSPAGSRFLEGTPLAMETSRSVAAPYGRILWSVQAGLVLLAVGSGFLAAQSGRMPSRIFDLVHGAALLGVCLGIGFIVSAGAAYLISRRLGLITSPRP